MPSNTLPDPDTIQYPLVNPQLFLSVSDDPPGIGKTIKTPFAFYVENFALSGDLKTENQNDEPLNEYSIFTSELYGPELTGEGCNIVLSGKAGDENHPNAYQGGVLRIYAEHVQSSTAEKLHFNTQGGAGLNREPVNGQDTGPAGGDGGKGGIITIIVDSKFQLTLESCKRLLKGLQDKQKKWPTDFRGDVREFVALVTLKEISAVYPLPEPLTTVEEILKASEEPVTEVLSSAFEKLADQRESLRSTLTQHINVDGGAYGTGAKGDKAQGKNGAEGPLGSYLACRLDETTKILNSEVCFAHPTQCRMLLDMANLLWFCGTLNEKARAATIFSRLARRLSFLGTAADKVKISKTNLANAYRKAEPSLFILSGDSQQEPMSFGLLRSIKGEAEGNLMSLLSGNSVLGEKQDKVPRGSFKFYEDAVAPLIINLEKSEKTYRKFLRGEMNAQEKKEAIQDRESKCAFRKTLVDNQIKQTKNELEDNLERINISTESIGPAKTSLLNAFEPVRHEVETNVKVSFEDLMSALSQVVFVHGSAPMVVVQAGDLTNTAITKLESDSGVKVNRSLLLKQLRDIKGSIKGLAEGFNLLKEGGVNFDDPGATKLQVVAQETENLLGNFEDILGKATLDNLKQRFDDYIDIVEQRNTAVVGYTKAVALLIKYQTELDSLAVEQADVTRQEYDQLGADHPTMTAFMKKLYTDAIHTTQQWLYKAQLAYQFVSLDKENYIGKQMEGFKFSQFNATTLSSVYSTLSTRYKDYTEVMGSNPQRFQGLEYNIGDKDVAIFSDHGKEGILHDIPIPVVPSKGPNRFGSMVDIRLTKVRFYLEGAHTDNGYLDMTLKHQGMETILNKQHERFDFEHAPLVFKFKYNMNDPSHMGDNTTDGNISSVVADDYAKVGPFTRWKIQILPDNNGGLDLSCVKKGYFKFWFNYYETM